MFKTKETSSDTFVLAALASVIAGVAGYLAGSRNHAERTAAAEKLQAQYAADRAASLLANKRYIEETAAAKAKARAQERADAERLAALTPKQRQVFEEERAHDEKVAREKRELEWRLALEQQKAQALVNAESRKANAQEELLNETKRLRRDVKELREDRYWDSYALVWRYY